MGSGRASRLWRFQSSLDSSYNVAGNGSCPFLLPRAMTTKLTSDSSRIFKGRPAKADMRPRRAPSGCQCSGPYSLRSLGCQYIPLNFRLPSLFHTVFLAPVRLSTVRQALGESSHRNRICLHHDSSKVHVICLLRARQYSTISSRILLVFRF